MTVIWYVLHTSIWYDMRTAHTYASIIHASYHNACIDDHTMLLTYIYM